MTYILERRVPGTSKLNRVGEVSNLKAAVNYLQSIVGYVSEVHGLVDRKGYELHVTEGQKSARYELTEKEPRND